MHDSWLHTSYAQQIRFGPASAARLRPLLKEVGARRVLVLTSPGVRAAAVIEGLGRAVVGTFDESARHVPVPVVRSAAARARADDVDALVTIGGGSVVDLAKAVAFFAEQQAGTPGVSFADRPHFAHLAVPTTLAGAEGSPAFAMTDPASRHKQLAESPTLVPRWTVYDPALVESTPGPVLASSGMTALAQALHALVTPNGPEAEAVAGAAWRRLFASLAPAASGDPTARAAAVEAAALAARTRQNGAASLTEALAFLLGGRCGADHGAAVALLLPAVLRFNSDALGARAEQAAAAVGVSDLPAALEELRDELGLPSGLSAMGVSDDDVGAVARLAQQHPAWRANPRPVGEGDVIGIVEAAW